jgi:TPR repeat protein
MYQLGHGVEKDAAKAEALYRDAASKGSIAAVKLLEVMDKDYS